MRPFFWRYISANTEITASRALWPRKPAQRHPIDPVAFFVALIGAPLLVALLGFPAFFIPVGALILGGIPYVLIGGPILAIALSRGIVRPSKLAVLGAKTVLVLCIPVTAAVAIALVFNQQEIEFQVGILVVLFAGLCALVAAIWASVFGALYARLRKSSTPSAI